MTAKPLPNRYDVDDESPTLQMRTLVLDRGSRPSQESGFWPVQAPASYVGPAPAPRPAPQPVDTLDPALRAISDPNAAFATWQDQAMSSAAASMVVRAASVATPLPQPPRSVPPPPRAPSTPPVGATLSPDGTLLPWRDPPPASSRGSILIALAVLLTGAGAAAVGYTRAATTGPATVPVHVARAVEHVPRDLVVDSAEKRAPVASATPERPRPRRRPRPSVPTPASSASSPSSDASAPAVEAPPPASDSTD
jgi:hypothetical protein